MNYSEAINYIHSINWTFCKPGLDRIRELCELIGNPQKELKFVHVAGTNGKGSFCSMLDSVLREAGYKVGLFTSPYILKFNERMQFCGQEISDSELASITEYVKPYADSMKDKPTEFELITAIGFEFFKRKGCDIVILEAGMGGRLDSTNIIDSSLLSVITGISLDHTSFLGDTIEKIAAEKAGIIKHTSSVLYGGNDAHVRKIIEDTARRNSSRFYNTSLDEIKNISFSLEGTTFDYKDRTGLRLSLLGSYQPHNAAKVLDAVDILNDLGFEISEDAVSKGLRNATWHARFEIISNDPLIIYDGAHNPEGIDAACKSIELYFGNQKVAIVSGVMKDKDFNYISDRLASVAVRAFCVKPDNPRALDAKSYSAILSSKSIEATPHESLKDALRSAIEYSILTSTPLVCLGSLYMYSELISAYNSLIKNKEA